MGDATKYNLEDYTLECCPYCDCSEQVIFSKGITRCPNCGKPLAPCSVCEECTPPFVLTGVMELLMMNLRR